MFPFHLSFIHVHIHIHARNTSTWFRFTSIALHALSKSIHQIGRLATDFKIKTVHERSSNSKSKIKEEHTPRTKQSKIYIITSNDYLRARVCVCVCNYGFQCTICLWWNNKWNCAIRVQQIHVYFWLYVSDQHIVLGSTHCQFRGNNNENK